jgi:hypothetical protein
MPVSGGCSILQEVVRQTRLADPFRDLQIGPAGILEQFRQFQAHGRILIEQELFEQRLMDRYHLLQVGPGEVHCGHRIFAGLMTAEDSPASAEADYATASYSDGASQNPSVRNRMLASVLAEIALTGGVRSLTSSMYGSA